MNFDYFILLSLVTSVLCKVIDSDNLILKSYFSKNVERYLQSNDFEISKHSCIKDIVLSNQSHRVHEVKNGIFYNAIDLNWYNKFISLLFPKYKGIFKPQQRWHHSLSQAFQQALSMCNFTELITLRYSALGNSQFEKFQKIPGK